MNALFHFAARPPRGGLLRLIIDHNPFYLFSALCMLFGLLTLTNSLSFSPIPSRHLLLLIATLNCYEMLLVFLSLWLIVERKIVRDGAILLGIEALFLADAAMLNAELFTVDRRLGAIVNIALLLLAAAKLALIFRALRVRSAGAYALILANLVLLFGLPGIFKQVSTSHSGRLAPAMVYAAWWAVGVLPVLFAAVFRRPAVGSLSSADHRPQSHGRIILTFVGFAFVSILVHLRLANWVYQVNWEWSNLSPLLLGLAICIGLLDGQPQTSTFRSRTQLGLPVLAVLLSLSFGHELLFSIGPVWFSPMRLALAGSAAVYLHGLWLHRHLYFALACVVCLTSIGLGTSPGAAVQNLYATWNALVAMYRRLQPRTASDWGLLSMMASFVLLLLGAAVSLLRSPASGEENLSATGGNEVPPAHA